MFNASGVTNRDFCLICHTEVSNTHILDVQQSIEDSRVPVYKGFVRARNLFTGTLLERISDTETKMTYCGQIDLCGFIPHFVANIVNISQPLCIAALRDYATKLFAQTKPPI